MLGIRLLTTHSSHAKHCRRYKICSYPFSPMTTCLLASLSDTIYERAVTASFTTRLSLECNKAHMVRTPPSSTNWSWQVKHIGIIWQDQRSKIMIKWPRNIWYVMILMLWLFFYTFSNLGFGLFIQESTSKILTHEMAFQGSFLSSNNRMLNYIVISKGLWSSLDSWQEIQTLCQSKDSLMIFRDCQRSCKELYKQLILRPQKSPSK